MTNKPTMTWENPLSTPAGSVLPLSLQLTVFNNQYYFNLRLDKQLDSTRQQRSSQQPSPSAPWQWLWLPTGVLPVGKLVSLLGNPSNKGPHRPHRLPGTCYWWEAAKYPASHTAWHRDRSVIPRAILQTSLSKSATGMWWNRQGLPKEAPKKLIVLTNDNLYQSHWGLHFTSCVKMCLCLTLAMAGISEFVSLKTA